jgi:hypothetical protein
MYENRVEDKTSKIGRLNSVKTYAFNNPAPVSSTVLTYGHDILNDGVNNYQGYYSGGVLMFDRVKGASSTEIVHKLNRTTILRYPYVLTKIVNSKDGFTGETQNKSWDFITGIVLEKQTKSSLGINTKTVLKPAYHIPEYSEMASKALSISNKNMLSQVAGSYTYQTDPAGNILGLISANAQTWRKDWDNYRIYNSSGTTFNEGPEGAGIWRTGSSYSWIGDYSRLQPDGTMSFSVSDQFNFAPGASNLRWLYRGENLRFDHFGMPLETKDMNNICTAVKMGYDERTVVASATNARYHEIAFGSAEDLYPDKPFFGGEVGLGNGSVKYLSKGQTASTHTGDAVVAVSSGYSFVFKTSGLKAERRYKASVWTNNANGKIYCKVNGGAEIIPSQALTTPVNGWYRIDMMLPTQTTDYVLEIGVKSGNGAEVLFDDFRFQPVESNMTCYVHPPLDFEFTVSPTSSFTYTLDNDNLYSKFEHNERGMLVRTYRESITYGVKLLSGAKNNYRRFHLNQ